MKLAWLIKRGGWGEGGAQPPPPLPPHLQTQCSHHGLQLFICLEKTHDGFQSFICFEISLNGLKKRESWGGCSQHNARMTAFNRSMCLKQACITQKGGGGVKRLERPKEAGGVGGGGGQPPPFANTMLASCVSIVICLERSGLMGFYRSYAVKKACTA